MTDLVQSLVNLAIQEDVGSGDLTSDVLFDKKDQERGAVILAKERLIVAGLDAARKTFLTIDSHVLFEALFAEGAVVQKDQVIAKLSGKLISLLKGERIALNFLQHLSGIATETRRYVEKVGKYRAEILDTRKTTPGLRTLEKKAVRMGGGTNHRMGLYDRILIKDNHIHACGSVDEALRRVKKNNSHGRKIEIEVEQAEQIPAVVAGGVDIILLDNFLPREAKKAVKKIKKLAGKRPILVEVSGGVTWDNVVKYARTGADRISIGALTHSSRAVDISMQVI